MRVLIQLDSLLASVFCRCLPRAPARRKPTRWRAVKADRWADAQAEAARFADPVRRKNSCCTCACAHPAPPRRRKSRCSCSATRIGRHRACLNAAARKLLATDPDDAAVLAQCERPRRRPWPPPCCAAPRQPPMPAATADANALARRAWVEAIDDATAEAAFLRRWGGLATPEDEWSRFQRLAWSNDPGRHPPDDRQA